MLCIRFMAAKFRAIWPGRKPETGIISKKYHYQRKFCTYLQILYFKGILTLHVRKLSDNGLNMRICP